MSQIHFELASISKNQSSNFRGFTVQISFNIRVFLKMGVLIFEVLLYKYPYSALNIQLYIPSLIQQMLVYFTSQLHFSRILSPLKSTVILFNKILEK